MPTDRVWFDEPSPPPPPERAIAWAIVGLMILVGATGYGLVMWAAFEAAWRWTMGGSR